LIFDLSHRIEQKWAETEQSLFSRGGDGMNTARQRPRLLVVDRQRENRDAMADVFRSRFEVVPALDGDMALELLEQDSEFAAVLLTCRLYETSGFDVLLRMHAAHLLERVPVIAIGEPEDELKALMMGATDFVAAPTNIVCLKQRLKRILAAKQIEDGCDILTGQWNRQRFLAEAQRLIRCRPDVRFTMVYTNIEQFHRINNLYGQRTGDLILRTMGQTLAKLCPEGVVGRPDGDHFAVCCPTDTFYPERVVECAAGIMRQLRLHRSMRLTLGIYDIDDPELPIQIMYERAEMALRALEPNTSAFIRYDETLRQKLQEEQDIVNHQESALRSGQFQVYLQPIYSLSTGAPVSAEALVRWVHPTRGMIPPDRFIPLFERNGFITQLDFYVWETVFRYLSEFKKRGYPDFPISANMSRVDFYDPGICDVIQQLSQKYDVSPSLFRVEVTESAYMDDPERMLEMIRQLNSAGFRVLMDDFGSGYSSLSMLINIPVSALKIDMGFVGGIGTSERSNSVFSSVIRMAKWLEMAVVAEGVETQIQLDYLKSVGCDRVQGYYYSKPLPLANFQGLISNFQRDQINETPQFFDQVNIQEIWKILAHDDHILGDVLGALGIYELCGDMVELVSVNNEYYQLMGTTPDELFRGAYNTMAWICEQDRPVFLGALNRAFAERHRQDLVIHRYTHTAILMRLILGISYIGRKDNRMLFAISLREISRGLELTAAAPPEYPEIEPASPTQSGRPRVLIVEDNQVNRVMLRTILAADYEVLEASNGREALAVLKQAPDLSAILLDIIMPVMDGFEFLKIRRKNPEIRRIPVLVLSQIETWDDECRARALGAEDFIHKPYEPGQVLDLLKKLILPGKT
jgi:diguanylate cyclase (GGDEF)-like protein